MNWFKQARNKGRSGPLMDDYSRGDRPGTEDHIRNPDGLTTPSGEFGGNERPGYPRGFSQNPENSDDPQWAKLHGKIPGEPVLMDDRENDMGEPGDSHDGIGDSFVAQDEFNTDNDRSALREKKLDNIDTGPHNMPHGPKNIQRSDVFNRVKDKIKTRGVKL